LNSFRSKWKALPTCLPVADDAGLGKTISSIVAYNSDPGKALVICPPFLKLNWAREFKKWEITGARIAWIEKGTDFDPYIMKHSDVIIVPDSLVARPKIQQILIKEKFKWLFIDEAHRFKGQKTKRTVAVFGDSESHSSLSSPFQSRRKRRRVIWDPDAQSTDRTIPLGECACVRSRGLQKFFRIR
jgi:hypothetical protein